MTYGGPNNEGLQGLQVSRVVITRLPIPEVGSSLSEPRGLVEERRGSLE